MAQTPLGFPFGFYTNDDLPQDAKYYSISNQAPYASVAACNAELAIGVRYEGLTVRIVDEDYWYDGGIEDVNLVKASAFVPLAGTKPDTVMDGYFQLSTGGIFMQTLVQEPDQNQGQFELWAKGVDLYYESIHGWADILVRETTGGKNPEIVISLEADDPTDLVTPNRERLEIQLESSIELGAIYRVTADIVAGTPRFSGIEYGDHYTNYADSASVTTYDFFLPDIKFIKDAITALGGEGGAFVPLAGTDLMDGIFKMSNASRLDSSSTTLNIGTTNASIVNLGTKTSSTVNLGGAQGFIAVGDTNRMLFTSTIADANLLTIGYIPFSYDVNGIRLESAIGGNIVNIFPTIITIGDSNNSVHHKKDRLTFSFASFQTDLVCTTATANRTITFQNGTGTVAFLSDLSGGGDAMVANPLSQFASTTSDQLAGVMSNKTGTGLLSFATSPTFVTPILGVAAATSINKVTITAPATGSTLTILDGKTLTVNNTLTFSGTDASTLNIGAGGTLGSNAYTSTAYAPIANPTFTGTVILPTGSTSAVPVLMVSAALKTTAVAGGVEFLTDKFYATITTGAVRKELTLNDQALTSGRIPYVTTNGRLSDTAAILFVGASTNILTTYHIDLVGGAAISLRMGSDAATAGTRTNNANKGGRFAGHHYTNAEEPIGFIEYLSTSSASTVNIGGGNSLLNSATTLNFYTAANNTTTFGTVRMSIDSGGLVSIGTQTATAFLHINAGNTTNPPIRLTSGPLTTGGNILAGNIEFLTDDFYATTTTGPTQYRIALSNTALTSDRVATTTTNGRLSYSATTTTELALLSGLTKIVTSDNANSVIEIINDFVGTSSGTLASQTANGGAVTNASTKDPGGRNGITNLSTSTSTNGRAGVGSTDTTIYLGNGAVKYEVSFKTPAALSDATNTYVIQLGFIDDYNNAVANGVWLSYKHDENTGKFRLNTMDNSVTSTLDTGTTMAAGTFYKFTITINAAGTQADISVNGGANVGAGLSTNIPITSNRTVGFGANIIKTAGTTNRFIDVDYITYRCILTTPR